MKNRAALFRSLAAVLLLFGINIQTVQADVKAPKKEIIKISEQGVKPAVLNLEGADGSVFFYNTSGDQFMSFSIPWGDRRAHCATLNLKLDEDKVLRSAKAIRPGDFVLTCFPEPGRYEYQAQVGQNKFKGTIIVKAYESEKPNKRNEKSSKGNS